MDHEPEIEFEINPKAAALKRFAMTEDECVDVVAEGLQAYLEELGAAPQDVRMPSFTEHTVQVKGTLLPPRTISPTSPSPGGSELPPA